MGPAERLLAVSQAGFDRSLVDHRPDPADFVVLELVEDMLAELHTPAIDRQAHEGGFGRAIEEQPGTIRISLLTRIVRAFFLLIDQKLRAVSNTWTVTEMAGIDDYCVASSPTIETCHGY